MRIVDRGKQWLAYQLGSHYPTAVMITDRVAGAFLLAFGAKLIGSGLDVHNVVSLSYWQTAATAGVMAVLALAQSLITAAITGHPALLSFTSRTLRRQTELHQGLPPRPRQNVPYRPNRKVLPR